MKIFLGSMAILLLWLLADILFFVGVWLIRRRNQRRRRA